VSRSCEITLAANQDIDRILSRLALASGFDATEKFLSRLNAKFRNLASFPFMGVARPEWGEDHRSIPIDRYVVVYRVTDELVEIIRIMSGYQDLDEFFIDR
jgi:toxin ParE1/3/4